MDDALDSGADANIDEADWAAYARAWADSPRMTPRQAYAITAVLELWGDEELGPWLEDPSAPLNQVAPLVYFDSRVTALIGTDLEWVRALRARCYDIAKDLSRGILPFDRPGPYIDELLVAAALPTAKAEMSDLPELFEDIPARAGSGDEDHYLLGDDEWDLLSDGFDDICRWDEWEVPLYQDHPLLGRILSERPPATWFDLVPASGPGYLQGLADQAAR